MTRAAFACTCLFFLAMGFPAAAAPDDDPPFLDYGGSRSSSGWLTLPNGTQVAVDEGLEWQGVKVYLSLTDDLVAVDAASGKTLWHRSVGMFWNRVGFRALETPDRGKTWAVALRRTRGGRAEAGFVQYHDLRTGEVLADPEAPALPSGNRIAPLRSWHGASACLQRRFTTLVTTEINWHDLRNALFEAASRRGGREGASIPDFGTIDFSREMLLVVFGGDSSNCDGFSVQEAYENQDRLMVRLHAHTYQTMERGVFARPWGIFVLPRSDKAVEVERNAQRYINGPPIWKMLQRLPGPRDPLRELESVERGC